MTKKPHGTRKAQGTEFFCWELVAFLGIELNKCKWIALLNGSVQVQRTWHWTPCEQCEPSSSVWWSQPDLSLCRCHLTTWGHRHPQTAAKNLEAQVLWVTLLLVLNTKWNPILIPRRWEKFLLYSRQQRKVADSTNRVNGTARVPVTAKRFGCYTVLFPNTSTFASNAFLVMSSKCFTKIQTFKKKIITGFGCIFLWAQAESLKGTFEKLAWQLVQQTSISEAAGTQKTDKNEGIQKPSTSFRNLWPASPISCIFKT